MKKYIILEDSDEIFFSAIKGHFDDLKDARTFARLFRKLHPDVKLLICTALEKVS